MPLNIKSIAAFGPTAGSGWAFQVETEGVGFGVLEAGLYFPDDKQPRETFTQQIRGGPFSKAPKVNVRFNTAMPPAGTVVTAKVVIKKGLGFLRAGETKDVVMATIAHGAGSSGGAAHGEEEGGGGGGTSGSGGGATGSSSSSSGSSLPAVSNEPQGQQFSGVDLPDVT